MTSLRYVNRFSIRRWATVLVVTVAGLGLVGCAGGQDPEAEGCTPAPTPPVELTGALTVFDLTGVAETTRVTQQDNFFVINAISTGQISDLAIRFVEILQNGGFDIAGSDDEGFEAEVFFASGQIAAGQVVLTESTCPGVVDVRISVLNDPAVLPGGSASAEKPTETPSST